MGGNQMENKPEEKKIKWRLNLFDIIFIVCLLAAAGFIIGYFGLSGGVLSAAGSRETITYTIELQEMAGDTARLPKPGDEIVDRIEKRPLGTVVSAEVRPSHSMQINFETGEMVMSVIPDSLNAVLVIEADVTVTESQIRIGRFILRIGTQVSIGGPLYSGTGFVTDIERSDAA